MLKAVISLLEFFFYPSKKMSQTNLKIWKSFNNKFGLLWKKSEKYFSSKINFSTFLQLSCSNFRLTCDKDLTVTKNVKKIGLKGLEQLRSKNCFQRQSWTKYLRLTLVFMRNSALQEKFNCFSGVFANVNKILKLGGELGTRQ